MLAKTLTIELLEDLHLGTGLGRGDIDSTQQRDKKGKPVIPATHIKGLLKQTALDLHQLAPDYLTKETIHLLFGYKAHQQGQLKLTSAYLEQNSCETLTWGSTKIGDKGIAEEGSLRQVEYIPAGEKFTLEINLPKQHQDLLETLELIIGRCTHLGASRNRGQGLVHWTIKSQPPARKHRLKQPNHFPARLRLLIKNLEPLCFASTAHPGNLITTESFIPSKALCGSMVAQCLKSGHKELAQSLLEPTLSWGNGYALPSGFEIKNNLAKLQILPIPLSMGSLKTPKGLQGSKNHPWWAFKADFINLGERGGVDQLTLKENKKDTNNEREKLKRPAANELVFSAGGRLWQRYKPQIMERLRNQVPSEQNNFQQSLFSNEEIAEDTYFLADLVVTNKEQANALTKALDIIGTQWLQLGRGGRPAIIDQATWLKDHSSVKPKKPGNSFNLLLESELVVRDRYGNFYDRLDEEALLKLAGITENLDIEIADRKNFSEGKMLFGFNASTGLPSQAVQAIKAGSAIKIIGKDAPKLFDAFKQKICLGEYTHLGCGRFRLNNVPEPTKPNLNPKISPAPSKQSQREQQREQLCSEAKELATQITYFNRPKKKEDKPSASQWGEFRNLVQAAKSPAELQKTLNRFSAASKKQGGKAWLGFFETRNEAAQAIINDIENATEQQLSTIQEKLEFFFRWQRALEKASEQSETEKES